jgi:uncharacterized protein YifE (UPF0438 family)
MHYNENGTREVATRTDGTQMYCLSWPKGKHGDYTVREIKVKASYGKKSSSLINATKHYMHVS